MSPLAMADDSLLPSNGIGSSHSQRTRTLKQGTTTTTYPLSDKHITTTGSAVGSNDGKRSKWADEN
jgi:hypothetical protein